MRVAFLRGGGGGGEGVLQKWKRLLTQRSPTCIVEAHGYNLPRTSGVRKDAYFLLLPSGHDKTICTLFNY